MPKNFKNLYLATTSGDKLSEFQEILGFKPRRTNLPFYEIQAIEVEKVVEHKTKQAFEEIKKAVICEDTGLYLKEWNGLPGALAKIFEKTIGWEGICKILKGSREAKAQTVIGFCDNKGYKSFKGEISGEIAKSPRGENGFGWDTIFVPKGSDKTFAEMSPEEKNSVSMRKIALEKLKNFLKI